MLARTAAWPGRLGYTGSGRTPDSGNNPARVSRLRNVAIAALHEAASSEAAGTFCSPARLARPMQAGEYRFAREASPLEVYDRMRGATRSH
jgi:hypothetical protein